MIESLTDIKNILTQIFTNYKPWGIVPTLLTTNSKTTPLTDCVIHQTGMFAHITSIYSHHSAWLGRKVVTEKLFKILFADKADPSGIFLFSCSQSSLFCQTANLRLFQMSQWEHGFLKLFLRQLA